MTKSPVTFPPCKFPTHSEPRVWLLTSGASPVSIYLCRQLLAHGDSVVLCVRPSDVTVSISARAVDFLAFWDEEVLVKHGWRSRARMVEMDARNMSQCQAAVAQAVAAFQKLDVLLCCSSEAIVGTVEELGASSRTAALIRDQFETNYFGHVNMIKAVLPSMRQNGLGHVVLLSGISQRYTITGSTEYAQWLTQRCSRASGYSWAWGSLGYEVAPFNIKVTIVQPNVEINVLTNPITTAPQQPQYSREKNPAPLFREIIEGLLSRLEPLFQSVPSESSEGHESSARFSSDEIVTTYPQMSEYTRRQLLAETINALTAIGGHDNPPARHIVGHEGVTSVKEKLKTVSEELEDFVEASCAVDIDGESGSPQQGKGDNDTV
ncbi:MAG: hypothetical protein LQ352_006681 [Teloschistes flavicans]|nr:MAG: hypothetical protein LQ352_006681 [Teloschistes flavicans]